MYNIFSSSRYYLLKPVKSLATELMIHILDSKVIIAQGYK